MLFSQVLFFCSRAQLSQDLNDWQRLNIYQKENAQLKTEKNLGDRVVFLGNSITDFWIDSSAQFFGDNHFVDRGINGQTSPQLLLRFQQDVVHLNPKAVVLLCGINDIFGNTGPSTQEMIQDNIISMAELARANGIKIILCSVLPVYIYTRKPDLRPSSRIIALNQWIKAYADQSKIPYIDYYNALVDDKGGMKSIFAKDGVHPNKAGYAVMESVALPVIRKLVKKKKS